MLYKLLIRPLLFALSTGDAERAHKLVITLLHYLGTPHVLSQAVGNFLRVDDPVELLGIRFPNRVGLAAGLDKDARAIWALSALGFGFLEVGTVTAKEQAGNPRPRIFRFPKDEALINAMGFNNHGAAKMMQTLSRSGKPLIPIGISLGKSKVVDPEDLGAVIEDHLYSLLLLHQFGDYFALNVSSPNTPGLRGLQGKEQLSTLLKALQAKLIALAQGQQPKPLLVKIAPDLTPDAIDDVLQVCADESVPGIIATNTTLSREGLSSPTDVSGGLSGRPLTDKALSVVRHVRRQAPNLLIIGVGGIFTIDDARRMIEVAGADLVQLYTGLIYEGPSLPRKIARGVKFAPSRIASPSL
ncbi:quinone-dependent dihydroorotate dehydrogenase [Patescibacteria group bacterium]|nr:quinone-dependent dihydroorotate dehydrogenase [Patescibacteria group bacterium]